jgi:MFS family permease
MAGSGPLILRLTAANFAVNGVSNTYYLLAAYLTCLGLDDPRAAGWVLGSYYAASTLSRPFVGWLVERLPFRSSFFVGGAGLLAGTLGLALSGPSLAMLLFWRSLTGIGASLFLVALTTYQTLCVPEDHRGSSFALTSAGSIAPLVTFVPLAEAFLAGGHPRAYVLLPVAISLFCLLLALPFDPGERSIEPGEKPGTYVELFRRRPIVILFLSVTLFALTDAAMLSVTGLAHSKGLVASGFIAANAGLSVLIRITAFRLMDRLPRMALVAPSLAFTSLGLLLASFAEGNASFTACGLLFGIGMGFGFPMHLALIGDVAPRHLRAKTSSMVWFFMACCFSLSPLIMGYLAALWNYEAAFRLFGGGLIVIAPLLHWGLWLPLARHRTATA